MLESKIKFSLEVFPFKGYETNQDFFDTIAKLNELGPEFFSVTTNHVWQTSRKTKNLVLRLQDQTKKPVAAHIVGLDYDVGFLNELAKEYWNAGITDVVVLRGDMSKSNDTKVNYASKVVKIFKKNADFNIIVAGYPDKHPQASTLDADLDSLKIKVDNGADQIITQFFFDPEIFLQYRDKVVARNITIPIIPGIMPIKSFKSLEKMSKLCQIEIPEFLREMFKDQNQELNQMLLSMNILSHQVTKLIDNGVKHFHLYTLNRSVLTYQICRWIKIAF